MALEGGLARAAEFERCRREPMSGAELRRMVHRRSLDFAGQLRVLYTFDLAGPESPWQLLEPGLLDGGLPPTLDPVVRALRTLAGADGHALRPMHRSAAEAARTSPLGFARLVIEEALSILRAADWPNFAPLAYTGELLTDPFLAASAPRFHADVLARVALHLAEHHALGPSSTEHRHWLERAAGLLGDGTGAPEIRALFFEADAMQALREEDISAALRDLLRANVLLSGVQPVDRRAETLLRYALVLARHPGAASRAPLVLETALAHLTELEGHLQPSLRLRLLHFLADIEVRLVFARTASLAPLPAGQALPDTPELVSRSRRWADALANHLPALRQAAAHLRAAETLYDFYGTPRLAAHRSAVVGRVLLASTPELAVIYLSSAQRALERLGDAARAAEALADLAVCHALLGRRREAEDALADLDQARQETSPALPAVVDDLSLMLRDLLPEAGGRVEEDTVLGEVLELPGGRQVGGHAG